MVVVEVTQPEALLMITVTMILLMLSLQLVCMVLYAAAVEPNGNVTVHM